MTPRALMHGAALNVAARVGTLALGLAIVVIVARFGPEVQGAFALFIAAESLLVTLFSGLGLVLAREVSHHGTALPAALLRALLRASFALGLAAALALWTLSSLSEAEPYRSLWLLALAAPCLLLAPTASGLWLGQGRMGPLNLPQVAAPALVLAGLAAIAWGGPPGVGAVLVVWVGAKSAVGLATAWAALRQARAGDPAAAGGTPIPWRAHARFVLTVGLTNVVSMLNLRLTLFLLERQAGLAEAGVYSVAVRVAELLWVLSSSITLSAYHRIGMPDTARAAELTLRAVRVNLALALAGAPLLGVAAWFVLPPLLGPAYAGARLPLAILLPGVTLYAAASGLSAFYTNQQGRPIWSAGITGLSLALTLAVAAWSIPALGATGAALATSLAYMVAMAVALSSFLRDQGFGWDELLRGRQSGPA